MKILETVRKTTPSPQRNRNWLDQKLSFNPITNEGDNNQEKLIIEVELLQKDKQILLQELQHRVRNNLAIIMGIVEMQNEDITANALLSLKNTQSRIGTFVKVHELIFSQNDFKNIPIHGLFDKLYNQHKGNDSDFTLSVKVDELFLNINQAIPLGLICNEMLSLFRNELSNIDAIIINSDLSSMPEIDIIFTLHKADPNVLNKQFFWDNKTIEGRFINLLAMQLKASIEAHQSTDTKTLHLKFTKADISGSGADKFL